MSQIQEEILKEFDEKFSFAKGLQYTPKGYVRMWLITLLSSLEAETIQKTRAEDIAAVSKIEKSDAYDSEGQDVMRNRIINALQSLTHGKE